MKFFSRDFTTREKIFLLVMAIILLAILYYWCVDLPVRTRIAAAEAEQARVQPELDIVNAQVAELTEMKNEMDALAGSVSIMGSYNNSAEEVDLLNEIAYGSLAFFRGTSGCLYAFINAGR